MLMDSEVPALSAAIQRNRLFADSLTTKQLLEVLTRMLADLKRTGTTRHIPELADAVRSYTDQLRQVDKNARQILQLIEQIKNELHRISGPD